MKGAYCPQYGRKKLYSKRDNPFCLSDIFLLSHPLSKLSARNVKCIRVFNFGPHGQMIKGRTNLEISVLSSLLQRTITYRTGLRVNSNSNTYI